jgi:hypothetical protein
MLCLGSREPVGAYRVSVAELTVVVCTELVARFVMMVCEVVFVELFVVIGVVLGETGAAPPQYFELRDSPAVNELPVSPHMEVLHLYGKDDMLGR